MSALAACLQGVVDWLLAARVDLQHGVVVERCVTATGSGIADEDELLGAAIEILRSGRRPRQVFMLGQRHVHLYERSQSNPDLAVVVVAIRTANLGLLLVDLRRTTRAVCA